MIKARRHGQFKVLSKDYGNKKTVALLVFAGVVLAATVLGQTTKAPTISETEGQVTATLQPTSLQISNPTPQNLKLYLAEAVTKYGGNYNLIYSVITCESNWNPIAKNPDSAAFGVAQFMPSTFKGYCGGDYNNPYDQIKCMVIAFTDNMQGQWECFKILK